MAWTITEDFSPQGIAVLHDSGELPVFEGDSEEGVYGFIKFQYISFVRYITLEYREYGSWTAFLENMAIPENNGLVSFRGGTYHVDSIGDPEQYGGAGSLDNPMYTISLVLRRTDTTSGSGGTSGGTGTGGGAPRCDGSMSVVIGLGVPVVLSSPDVPNIFSPSDGLIRIPIAVDFSGNLFSGNASASVTFFEPHGLIATLMPHDFGGVWTLSVNGIVSFIGYVANMRTQRTVGDGYIKAMNFSGINKAWDVTCAAKILPVGATEETPSSTYTAKNALEDLVAVVSDGSMSGVSLDATIPDTSVLIRDMYSDHVLTITNSTYLAEIQRLAMYLGCAVFQHPSHNTIAIADVLHPNESIDGNFDKNRCSKASFDVNLETIAATVLVVDDATSDADSFGYLGVPSVPSNHDFTGRNDIAYASTIGIAKDHLKTIAEQLYYIGRYGSQVLRFKYAGLPSDVTMLGKIINWSDAIGGTGQYVVNSFATSYRRTSCWTEIEAYMKPSV